MPDLTSSGTPSQTVPEASDREAQSFTSLYLNQLSCSMQGPQEDLPVVSTVAVLLQHGGFQILLSPGRTAKRLLKHASYTADERTLLETAVQQGGENEERQKAALDLKASKEAEAAQAAIALQKTAAQFFQKLCPDAYYGIPSSLMSHLAFPHEGRTYTGRNELEAENQKIPSAFTFVGQFVDHDLTFNGLNLFDVQTNTTDHPIHTPGGNTAKPDPNFASPLIDLDSVYGRTYPRNTSDPGLKSLLRKRGLKHVYDGCRFRLTRLGPNAYDLPRWTNASAPNRVGSAWIFDPRNDENQLVLQIHTLVMRVHNKLVDGLAPQPPAGDPGHLENPTPEQMACIDEVRKKVVCIWQSVLLNDFLPRVCKQEVLDKVLAPGYAFHYKPDNTGLLTMPHEFAIGYRFGHSMLRSAYKLNPGPAVPLFDNRSTGKNVDLRGNTDLPLAHVIDWDVFLPADESKSTLALLIDSHVTPVVFDLPESAIPDDIRTDGNLPKRNLDRSRSIELGCGEDVAACLGVTATLTPDQVEPDASKQPLFQGDVNVYQTLNGKTVLVTANPFKGDKDLRFKTPLWYYILREAEVGEGGVTLGELGSTIVAEVIVQGIMNGPYAYNVANCANQELLPGKLGKDIKLRDLIDFVHES